MSRQYREELADIIIGLGEYYDKSLSPHQIGMYVEDLASLSPEQLVFAVKKYRQDPKNSFFPLPAKLIAIVVENDGRPGAEEAWSLCPRDDSSAVYLNDEIIAGWSAANAILNETNDKIAARMAFKEVYEKAVKTNRENGIVPKWWLSRAFGPGSESANEAALRIAVEKNRLTEPAAISLLPTYTPKKQNQIALNSDQKEAVQSLISTTFKSIEVKS